LVEANLNMATSLGDRHYLMDQGTIACTISAQQLVQDKTLLDRYLKI
jgi:ABC-type branched-subunit amino acid transport system ATPase component